MGCNPAFQCCSSFASNKIHCCMRQPEGAPGYCHQSVKAVIIAADCPHTHQKMQPHTSSQGLGVFSLAGIHQAAHAFRPQQSCSLNVCADCKTFQEVFAGIHAASGSRTCIQSTARPREALLAANATALQLEALPSGFLCPGSALPGC